MTTLIGVELLKIKKRRMSFILLGVLVFFFCLTFSLYYYVVVSSGESYRAALAMPLQFPDAIDLIFSTAQSAGSLVLVILASFMVGEEYGQGTVRQMMARVRTRSRYLGAKILSLLIIVLIVTAISLIVGTILASFTTSKLGGLSLDFITLSLLGEVAKMFGGTALTLAVNSFLAVLFTILARSAWAGIGGYIGYGLVEGIVSTVLSMGEGWPKDISQYLIGPNTFAFVHLEIEEFSFWLPEFYPSAIHATAVLLCWCAFFLGISFYLFRRRDITA